MRLSFIILLLFLCSVPVIPSSASESVRLDPEFGQVPLSFVLNEGQFDPELKFVAEGNNENVYPEDHIPITTVLVLDSPYRQAEKQALEESSSPKPAQDTNQIPILIHFYQPNFSFAVTGEDPYSWNSNYFFGNDPTKWKTDLPNYRSVRLHDLYPGIDLRYIAQERRITHEIVIHAGTDPSILKFWHNYPDNWIWKFDITPNGELFASRFNEGTTDKSTFPAPAAFQFIDGKQVPVSLKYSLLDKAAGIIGLVFGEYDSRYDIVIPYDQVYRNKFMTVRYIKQATGLDVDKDGNVYVAGEVSYSVPISSPRLHGIFAIKLLSGGKELGYVSYYGGGTGSTGSINFDRMRMKIDNTDFSVYIGGVTSSNGIPITPDAWDKTYDGGSIFGDVYLLKLSDEGNLLYSTYIGGSGDDWIGGMTIDSDGYLFISGWTASSNFIYSNTFGSSTNNTRGYILKFDINSNQFVYSDLFADASFSDIAVNSTNKVYVVGSIQNVATFPMPGALYTYNGATDAIILQLNSNGDNIYFATYLGGTGDDRALSIAFDKEDNIFIGGQTKSLDFPTTDGAFDTTYNNPTNQQACDIFIAKIDSNQMNTIYSTYVGGDGEDFLDNIMVDKIGKAIVVGKLNRTNNFPLTDNPKTSTGIFILEINETGSGIIFSNTIGIAQLIRAMIDLNDNIIMCGYMYNSTVFSVNTGLFDMGYSLAGHTGGFILKVIHYTSASVHNIIEENCFFKLFQPFPNPFNGEVVIPFFLPKEAYVSIEIRNIIGQKIMELLSEQKPKGLYYIRWNSQNCSNGVYMCVLKHENIINTKRIMLLK